MSDEALVAACAVGDVAALGALYDRHHEAVYRFLSRLAGCDGRDLDDLAQNTFLEANRASRGYRGRAPVRPWLFGIAANVVRHHVRGEIRRRALHVALGDRPADDPVQPDLPAERRQLIERLGAALPNLSHDLRVAFVLCDLEGVPGVEAARVVGVPEGTLWRRLHEARKALRAALDGEDR
jgi:RNA polymerase sigma-70 factor (ECF subfamily)